MACSDNKNPLQRGGTSQQERFPAGLKSDYVLIDERDFKDWIVFASQFATYINYYNASYIQTGNWQPFFNNDISAILGTIAIQNINDYKTLIKSAFDILRDNNNQTDADLLRETLGRLFSYILTLCKAIDGYYIKLPADNQLSSTIQNLVTQKLAPALQRLLNYYKAASPSFIIENDYHDVSILNKAVEKASTIILTEQLSLIWITTGSTLWNDYYQNDIKADDSIFGLAAWDVFRRINHAANHNLFTGIFDQFLKVYTNIIDSAESLLLQTLTNWNNHTPHYALFLTFLQLFKYSQQELNTLTQRHLDLYYKEILQLAPKSAVPDHANIIVQLAKQVDEYMLAQGTLFKAGKDSKGLEILYALDNDTVFNKAGVSQLMSLYQGDSNDNIGTVKNNGRLFASPIANSQDGLGAKLTSVNKEWHPFFNKEYTDGEVSAIDMPKAEIGFALASSYLFLNEGNRTINLRFVLDGTQLIPKNAAFDCYITTAKGWTQLNKPAIKYEKTTTNENCSTLSFNLSGKDPAITAYVDSIHKGVFNVSIPILTIYLRNDDAYTYQYNELKKFTVKKIEIEVEAGVNGTTFSQDGLKQILLAGDTGIIDPSKPFLPFGTQPQKGSSFIIGNGEVFSKPGAQIRLNVEWANMPDDATNIIYPAGSTYPTVKIRYLTDGKWIAGSTDDDIAIFSSNNDTVAFPSDFQELEDDVFVNYSDPYISYDNKANAGFIKLMLSGDFGYSDYQSAQINYLIGLANKTPNLTQPVAPYTPNIRSIYLSYKASCIVDITSNNETDFNNRSAQFFHLYPFGIVERHVYINGDTAIKLLPPFIYVNNGTTTIDVAEFYIGMENLLPQQGVNILFQVAEGTSDPTITKPDKHVSWSYLSENEWQAFNDQSVTDGTLQLIQSGIISFEIPEDATNNDTRMPAGYIWLRASVSEKPEAVCELLDVEAQAAQVTFFDNGADNSLNNPLPANTIAKLKNAISAIKSIAQPYVSFDGKPIEDSDSFYLRVSERLRHKDRAITIWDYERLVLEAFPAIHRVKCLNHTKYIDADYNEVAPGYVTVITIPDLVNREDVNPLRPYTNADVLKQIQNYLKDRISCHVNLNICNPKFEEVRLEFKLRLLAGYEFSYYSKVLKDGITAFLTPWAYGQSDDVQFGGKIEKSSLINFIEQQSYVDYITDVNMYQRINENGPESMNTDEIIASTAISVLVSAAASKHVITEITDEQAAQPIVTCTDPNNQINNNRKGTRDLTFTTKA